VHGSDDAREGAKGFLKEMFDKVMTPSGTVDNVMRVHSCVPNR